MYHEKMSQILVLNNTVTVNSMVHSKTNASSGNAYNLPSML